MDAYEKIVCRMFDVKGVEFIAKPRLVKALAIMNIDYESLHIDLFHAQPGHKRFEKLSAIELDGMRQLAEQRYGKPKENLWQKILKHIK